MGNLGLRCRGRCSEKVTVWYATGARVHGRGTLAELVAAPTSAVQGRRGIASLLPLLTALREAR